MWRCVVLTDNGEERGIPLQQIEGKHATLKDLTSLAQNRRSEPGPIPWSLIDRIIEQGPAPWSDPIPFWVSEGSVGDSTVARRQGNETVLISENYGTEVWHVPTAIVTVIPKDAKEIVIEYQWSEGMTFPGIPRAAAVSSLITTFDARLYVGKNSSIFEINQLPAETFFLPQFFRNALPVFRWRFNVRNLPGMLVGRIAQGFVRRPSPPSWDPGFKDRLREEESQIESDVCPRIEHFSESGKDLVVFVHGAFSCGVKDAVEIQKQNPFVSVVRFEHDTFVSIFDNARELVSHLTPLVAAGCNIVLIAHSRGGIVACQASALLRCKMDGVTIPVWTFGTPHRGTPWADVGGEPARVLGALYRLGARSILKSSTVDGAASYIVAASQLPLGIAAMGEGSEALSAHRMFCEVVKPWTWGGRVDASRGSGRGRGVLVSGAGEFFGGRPNDLVVPTMSAILNGSKPIDDCNHFEYFNKDKIDLNGFLIEHFDPEGG